MLPVLRMLLRIRLVVVAPGITGTVPRLRMAVDIRGTAEPELAQRTTVRAILGMAVEEERVPVPAMAEAATGTVEVQVVDLSGRRIVVGAGAQGTVAVMGAGTQVAVVRLEPPRGVPSNVALWGESLSR